MTFDSYLATSTVACTLFIVLVSLSKKSNTPLGYRFLSLLFLSLAFVFAEELIEEAKLYTLYPVLAIIFQPIIYIIGPLIYLSVYYLTTINGKLTLRKAFHIIPYFSVLVLYILVYISTPATESIVSNSSQEDKQVEFVLLFLLFVQLAIYLILSLRQLMKHQSTLPLFVSNLSDNDYRWLFNTIIGLTILSLLSFAEVVVAQIEQPFYFSFLYLAGIYYIGIQIVNQKDVFAFSTQEMKSVTDLIEDQLLAEVEQTVPTETDRKDKISRKVISDDQLIMYKEKLVLLMQQERPYMDSELTLPRLSAMAAMNTYQTSYLINTCFAENFYSFINRYRLEDCKKMLLSKEHADRSVLSIAFECGFNSKTTFNTSFKKDTGLSPKEFRNQHYDHG